MRKHITEKSGYVNGHLLLDFGKSCYAQLELDFNGIAQDLAEVIVADYAENDCAVHRTGWPTFKIDYIRVRPEQKTYRFNIPMHTCAYAAFPHVDTPASFGGEVAIFRYVEINHYYGPVTARRIEFFNDAAEDAAQFESDDEKLNKVWDFCKYSILALNIFPCFVDGERERMPYEGDAYITQLSHFCCTSEYATAKQTIDHFMVSGDKTWPTEWLLHTPLLAQGYQLYSGDSAPLKEWLKILPQRTLPHMFNADGLLVPTGHVRDIIDWPEGDRDNYELADNTKGKANFVPNAYCCGALKVMAELTGDDSYIKKAEELKANLRRRMMKNGLFVDNEDSSHTSLHTAMFALRFGLTDTPEETAAHQAIIRERGLVCSVYGVQFLLESCFVGGLDELGMAFLTNDGPRSWFNMMREGATTTMESWGENDKPFQDWSHPWGTAAANIIPRFVAGVRPTAPGFERFVVKPSPAAPKRFFLRHPTPFGAILVHKNGDQLEVELTGTSKKLNQTAPGEFQII